MLDKIYRNMMQRLKWQEEQGRAVSDWRYLILPFRHTKPNPKRKVRTWRKGFMWFGSHPNYEARLKNRWPVRFFLFYSLKRDIWWPLRYYFQRNKHFKRRADPMQFAEVKMFTEENAHIKGNVLDWLIMSPNCPEDPVAVSHDIEMARLIIKHALPYILAMTYRLEHNLMPRAGMGSIVLKDYPEMRVIKKAEADTKQQLAIIAETARKINRARNWQ